MKRQEGDQSDMAIRRSNSPYGYKELLVYKKAEELQKACAHFTSQMMQRAKREKGDGKGWKTVSALQDQMDRSARSIKQNIVEGWKRNSTQEYHQFLGFSIAANAELEEDCDDIIKGIYEMGGRGLKREEWGKGEEWGIDRVEKLPFYPLDPHLPSLVQLKLRCKELNFLLTKLQNSLHQKMSEGSRVLGGAWGTGETGKKGDEWINQALEEHDLVRLADGRLVPKEENGKKGENGGNGEEKTTGKGKGG